MPHSKVRVVGSGFTTLTYRGKRIAFLDSFQDSGQRPVGSGQNGGQGYDVVHELDKKVPTEVVTSRAIGAGTLSLTIRELWNEPVWYQLSGLEGTFDQVEVFRRLAAEPSEVTCQMLIKPPGSTVWRGKTYHNCTVVAIDDSESVSIGQLSVPRGISILYTHKTPLVTQATSVTS